MSTNTIWSLICSPFEILDLTSVTKFFTTTILNKLATFYSISRKPTDTTNLGFACVVEKARIPQITEESERKSKSERERDSKPFLRIQLSVVVRS